MPEGTVFTDPSVKVMADLIADEGLLVTYAGEIEKVGHRLHRAVLEIKRLCEMYDEEAKNNDPGPDHVYVKLQINVAKFFSYPPYGRETWADVHIEAVSQACREVV